MADAGELPQELRRMARPDTRGHKPSAQPQLPVNWSEIKARIILAKDLQPMNQANLGTKLDDQEPRPAPWSNTVVCFLGDDSLVAAGWEHIAAAALNGPLYFLQAGPGQNRAVS